MMAFPLSHKTVFLLDQSSVFAHACERIEIEAVKSTGNQGYIPMPHVDKSIWSSATESVLEYCRIVWDIFPPVNDDVNDHRLIRFVVFGDTDTQKVITDWDRKHQSSSVLANDLAFVGRPELTSNKFGSVAKAKEKLRLGIRQALEILTEQTEAQKNVHDRIMNRGRVVCLTNTEDLNAFTDMINTMLLQELSEVNSSAAGSSDLVSIAQVEVDVVCCFSGLSGHFSPFEDYSKQLSHALNYTVSCVPAGVELSKKLLCLALKHFDLASTTVTGIPMKEEQNASSSANYDVELFHKASAHWRLLTNDLSEESKVKNKDITNWLPQTEKEGCNYKTITLKWCTPRGNSADLHNTTCLARITPTDVNSRPSSCLTNFLLSGRSVMLEMPRRSGSKIMSHMLTSHGGEIFIHTLNISRSVLEDPPSISEGPGGRVTDYRIPDFVVLMKENRLANYYGQVKENEKQPLDKMRDRIVRYTKFCPMIISSTTIFNMEALEPLQKILVQEELTEENLAECRKIIYNLLNMEHRGEILPVPISNVSGSGKGKTMKKDDQYKLMFSELEKFIAVHCRSEKHHKVLDCLLESRNRPTSDRPSTATPRKDDKVELDVAIRELDRYSNMTDREKSDFNSANDQPTSKGPVRSFDSERPPVKKQKTSGQSLLDIWTKNSRNSLNTVPFAGMKSVTEKAKLYLSLERKEKESAISNTEELHQ